MERSADKPLAVICLIGISSSGKSTVLQRVARLEPLVHQPVSCTTRPQRAGETPGHEYHFVDEAEFAARVEAGEFAEHASFSGHRYGTLWAEIDRPGRIVMRVTENEGAKNLRRLVGAHVVAIVPPSDEVRSRRFAARGDDRAEIERRIAIDHARTEEILRIADHVIVNDDLAVAAAELHALVLRLSERAGSTADQRSERKDVAETEAFLADQTEPISDSDRQMIADALANGTPLPGTDRHKRIVAERRSKQTDVPPQLD